MPKQRTGPAGMRRKTEARGRRLCLAAGLLALTMPTSARADRPGTWSLRPSRSSALVLMTLGTASVMSTGLENGGALRRGIETSLLDGLSEFDFFGDGRLQAAGAVGLWGAGRLLDRRGMESLGKDLTLSLSLTSAAVWSLKAGLDAPRPNGGHHSFPSGHTAAAFCAATTLARHGGWKVGVPAYVAAAGTGVSRIEDGWHHLGDVVAGATLGILFGNEVALRRGRSGGPTLSATPGGVELRVRF
jgi:membrane-associated phospholipid phosphatase